MTDPEVARLRAIIDNAIEALCLLAEEVQPENQVLATQLWDLTAEHLELPLCLPAAALPSGEKKPQ